MIVVGAFELVTLGLRAYILGGIFSFGWFIAPDDLLSDTPEGLNEGASGSHLIGSNRA